MRVGSSLALCFAALTLSCGAAFDGQTYHGEGFSFRVPTVPTEWRPIQVSHASIAYDDPGSEGIVMVNGRCDRDGEDVPLSSLTQHLFMRFTDRETQHEEVLPFDGREAMRTEATAKLDGVERRFLVFVLKKDRCVYDLIYFAAPDRFDTGAPRFDAWAKGFTALPRDVDP
jgi:hypothetical protein